MTDKERIEREEELLSQLKALGHEEFPSMSLTDLEICLAFHHMAQNLASGNECSLCQPVIADSCCLYLGIVHCIQSNDGYEYEIYRIDKDIFSEDFTISLTKPLDSPLQYPPIVYNQKRNGVVYDFIKGITPTLKAYREWYIANSPYISKG